MESTTATSAPTAAVLPPLVRLETATVCGCGEHVAAGERVGYLSSEDGVACMACMADLQAGRLDLVDLAIRVQPDASQQDVEAVRRRVRAGRHTVEVSANADSLLGRFTAVRALGALAGELRPLSSFAPQH